MYLTKTNQVLFVSWLQAKDFQSAIFFKWVGNNMFTLFYCNTRILKND